MTQARPTTTAGLTHVKQDDREAHRRPLSMDIILRLFTYMGQHKAKRNAVMLLAIVRGIQMPILAALLGYIIKTPLTNGDWDATVTWIIIFGLWALLTQIVFRYRMRLALEIAEMVVHDLRCKIFDKLQIMNMSFFDKTKVGRIISRITSDSEAVRIGVQDVLFVTIMQTTQIITAAIIMICFDWVLFMVVLITAPILFVILRYFRRRLSSARRAVQESFSRVIATLAESVSGIRVTQGFAREDVNAQLFEELVEDHADYHLVADSRSGVFHGLLQSQHHLFIALLVIIGGYRALQGEGDAGNLIPFFFLANNFFGPLMMIGQQYDMALHSMAGAERIFELLDRQPEFVDPPEAVKLDPLQGFVEFDNVTFGYDPDVPVLRDINFKAEPGQTIAMVGATGCGKTTLVSLIAKYYLPTEGKLYIDEHNILDIDAYAMRRQMGIVMQKNFLFTGTVMDNIRISRPEATDEEVIDAARQLDVLDLIAMLPAGFGTDVGENGGNLSLGQQQIVCFTRAMLADPKILILDEATSSVDTMTESRIQHALEILLQGRTNFVVAHRLSTIRHADLVLVLDQGEIVERGTHNELLSQAGVYANLYKQFIRASEA